MRAGSRQYERVATGALHRVPQALDELLAAEGEQRLRGLGCLEPVPALAGPSAEIVGCEQAGVGNSWHGGAVEGVVEGSEPLTGEEPRRLVERGLEEALSLLRREGAEHSAERIGAKCPH